MKKTYKIPVIYSSWGIVEVEAISLEEACELARAGSLPYQAEYLDGSFKIDYASSIYLDQLDEEPENNSKARIKKNLEHIESLKDE